MSTRSCIARQVGESEFTGVYHHFDGYPGGLGSTLWDLYRGHFRRDLPLMLKTLINDHPAGWSTICERDFNKTIGYGMSGPNCYCHGERNEEANEITEKDAADCGCEYAYVFTENRKMKILSSYHPDGEKMIGLFGSGDHDATWRVIAEVDLEGEEPDWGRLDNE